MCPKRVQHSIQSHQEVLHIPNRPSWRRGPEEDLCQEEVLQHSIQMTEGSGSSPLPVDPDHELEGVSSEHQPAHPPVPGVHLDLQPHHEVFFFWDLTPVLHCLLHYLEEGLYFEEWILRLDCGVLVEPEFTQLHAGG